MSDFVRAVYHLTVDVTLSFDFLGSLLSSRVSQLMSLLWFCPSGDPVDIWERIIVSQRHIEIAGRKVRISETSLSDHVARHLGYVPHYFVRRGCDKTSMRWSLARLLFPPSPHPSSPPPVGPSHASYGVHAFLSVCTEENRKLELVPFSSRPKRTAPLIMIK